MGLFNKKNNSNDVSIIQTNRDNSNPFDGLIGYTPLANPETRLYDAIREAVPIIDAAITKILRLIGNFEISCDDTNAEYQINKFIKNIKVGASSIGLEEFLLIYLDNLLTYGNAVGEIIVSSDYSKILGLYNASINDIQVKQGENPLDIKFMKTFGDCKNVYIDNSNLILFSSLNPPASQIKGVSILRSLPFVCSTLISIYNSIGQNFERIGNVRYAVTYKPSSDTLDKAYAKQRAMQIAQEWSDGINSAKTGQVKDFVAVGDVNIKVIGADNQVLDTNIPVRQMLEQIVAKLSIPPFLLGLSWSTSERMSQQQSDILTSEIDYYRRLLTPVINKICKTFLVLSGFYCDFDINWNNINLQDEIERAKSRLYRAQALEIETNLKNKKMVVI